MSNDPNIISALELESIRLVRAELSLHYCCCAIQNKIQLTMAMATMMGMLAFILQ